MTAVEQLERADQALKVADNHFQWAVERQYVDKAIFNLCTAEHQVSSAQRRLRRELGFPIADCKEATVCAR